MSCSHADFPLFCPFSAFRTEVSCPVVMRTSPFFAYFRHLGRKFSSQRLYRLPAVLPIFGVLAGSFLPKALQTSGCFVCLRGFIRKFLSLRRCRLPSFFVKSRIECKYPLEKCCGLLREPQRWPAGTTKPARTAAERGDRLSRPRECTGARPVNISVIACGS